MDTHAIEVSREEAARMFRKYREHKHHQRPIDVEITAIYRAISKGGVVIKALASVVEAGLGTDGFPALAICRADAVNCFCSVDNDGSAIFTDQPWVNGRTAKDRVFRFEPGSFPVRGRHQRGQSIAPHIPPDILPARGLQNYHLLYEAVWKPVPPIDPMLLRRIGRGDTWLVVGAWDLTEVERAVMASRIPVRR